MWSCGHIFYEGQVPACKRYLFLLISLTSIKCLWKQRLSTFHVQQLLSKDSSVSIPRVPLSLQRHHQRQSNHHRHTVTQRFPWDAFTTHQVSERYLRIYSKAGRASSYKGNLTQAATCQRRFVCGIKGQGQAQGRRHLPSMPSSRFYRPMLHVRL